MYTLKVASRKRQLEELRKKYVLLYSGDIKRLKTFASLNNRETNNHKSHPATVKVPAE